MFLLVWVALAGLVLAYCIIRWIGAVVRLLWAIVSRPILLGILIAAGVAFALLGPG